MNLGEKIKECRKQAGFSQEQLAERLNVSRQAITKWETNKGIACAEPISWVFCAIFITISFVSAFKKIYKNKDLLD